jgi:hypothetical protein
LHNEELHNSYSFPNIIWQIKWRRRVGGTCSMVVVGKPEGKRPLDTPRRRWDRNGS